MPGNTFGKIFTITTFGESHGPALGVIIDGCPPNIELSTEDIQLEVNRRKPMAGSKITTQRLEKDQIEVLSGIFEGRTTGMPIAIIVRNEEQQSKDYSNLKDVFRPGHADYTFELKYGIRDHRGGGRSSGRETICRVMAGAVAKKMIHAYSPSCKILAHTIQVGSVKAKTFQAEEIDNNQMRCADPVAAAEMITYVESLRDQGDSAGAIIEIVIKNPPAGLGEPVFDKLHADLAKALMSIGTVKGFEIGKGFDVAESKGSENNDTFQSQNNTVKTTTNNAGGILGGISNGEDIIMKIAIKPPSSIAISQKTVNKDKENVELTIQGRHDACIAPRVIPVAESMVALTLADHILRLKTVK